MLFRFNEIPHCGGAPRHRAASPNPRGSSPGGLSDSASPYFPSRRRRGRQLRPTDGGYRSEIRRGPLSSSPGATDGPSATPQAAFGGRYAVCPTPTGGLLTLRVPRAHTIKFHGNAPAPVSEHLIATAWTMRPLPLARDRDGRTGVTVRRVALSVFEIPPLALVIGTMTA